MANDELLFTPIDPGNIEQWNSIEDMVDAPEAPPYTPAEQAEPEQEPLFPEAITGLGAELVNERDYDTAITQLKDAYSKNKFTDPEKAAQNFAEVANSLNVIHNRKVEPNLQADAVTLSNRMLDRTLSKEVKVKAIEDWRTEAKENLYNTDDPNQLVSAQVSEQLIDQYATELRRNVVAGDVGRMKDLFARAAEPAVGALAGTTDAIFGTTLRSQLGQVISDRTNPAYDESLVSTAAGAVGAIGGFAVASANPVTAYGYLAATLIDQSKSVYDAAIEGGASEDGAKSALMNSAPGIIVGTFADKIIGGSLGSVIKGNKGYIGALSGLAAGAGGAGVQSLTTATALRAGTGNEIFQPDLAKIAEESAVFGAIGGIVGAVSSHENTFKRAQKGIKDKLNPDRIPDVPGVKTVQEEGVPDPVELLKSQAKDKLQTVKEQKKEFQEALREADPEKRAEGAERLKEFDRKIKEQEDELALYELDGLDLDLPLDSESFIADVVEKDVPVERLDVVDLPDKLPPVKTPREQALEAAQEPKDPPIEITESSKIIPVRMVSDEAVPMPFLVHLARKMDGLLKFIPDASKDWAFYQAGDHSVNLKRRMFKNIEGSYTTFAHEIGHMIDYFSIKAAQLSPLKQSALLRKEGLAYKLVRFNDVIRKQLNEAAVHDEGRKLSASWRQDIWNENITDDIAKDLFKSGKITPEIYTYLRYRNRGTEIQADVISAIFNDPKFVEANYPQIWSAFTKGLKTHPTLETFWKSYEAINKDPNLLNAWLNKQYEAGRKVQAITVQAAAEEALRDKYGLQALRKAGISARDEIRLRAINALGVARDILSKFKSGSAEREKAEQLYAELSGYKAGLNKITHYIDIPFNKLANRAVNLKSLGTIYEENGKVKNKFENWKNFERLNRTINETTSTIEAIKDDPLQEYNVALEEILAKQSIASQIPMREKVNTLAQGEALVREAAKLQSFFQADTLRKLSLEFEQDGNFKAAELLNPDSFNVRGYLPNPLGLDINTARKQMAVLERQLGPEGFKELVDVSEEFHDILAGPLFDALEKSGIVSDKLLQRMKLNKNNYVTFNVLKYFLEDPRIDASLRKQYGTFEQIGDELTSTISKTKALLGRAEFQKGQNAAVELARMGGYGVKPIGPDYTFGYTKEGNTKVRTTSPFEQRDSLQKENPDNSYFITYEDGKPSLFEIDSPKWAQMFEQSRLDKAPVTGLALSLLEKYNLTFLEQGLKTAFSIPFGIRQRALDRVQEAIASRAKGIALPFIPVGKEGRALQRTSKPINKKFEQNVFTPETKALVDYNAIALHLATDFTGIDHHNIKAENVLYEMMGYPIPGADSVSLPHKINKALVSGLEKVGFGKVREQIESDERRAKINGYIIGRKRGMGEAEAARFAREYFGTPDPLGGGTEAANLNKLFLFGRAHINGMRSVFNQFKDDPRGYGIQYMYRKGIPRLMVSSAIMAPLISALFGEEEGELTRKYLDKIPDYEKISKFIIPLGFLNDAGEWVGWNVKADEVGTGYKASFFKMPTSRELVAIDQLMNPYVQALEDLLETGSIDPQKIIENQLQAFKNVGAANIAPGVLGAVRTTQFISGNNPWDYYRNRGVIPKDVQEAGSFIDKFYEYAIWSAAQTAPGLFSSVTDKQSLSEAQSPLDYLAKLPIAGPTGRAFFGTSNYGDYEKQIELKEQKTKIDADIRLGMGDATKAMYQDYRKAQAIVSSLGKGWDQQLPPAEVNRFHQMFNWFSQVYRHGFENARADYERADEESLDVTYQNLEETSKTYRESIR